MLYRTLIPLLSAAALLAGCDDGAVSRSLGPVAPPSFNKGQRVGQCFYHLGLEGTKVYPGEDGNAAVVAPDGKVVTRIAVKAGPTCVFTAKGAVGTYTIAAKNAPCYVVSGLGSEAATVTRVGAGWACKDISHVEFIAVPKPTAGLLQICTELSGALPSNRQLAPFKFVVAGIDVAVERGSCSNPIELPGGAFVITEAPIGFGIGLGNAATIPADRLIGFDVAAQTATVMVVTGSTTVVTITNLYVPDPGPDD